jgi:hypothetical protein
LESTVVIVVALDDLVGYVPAMVSKSDRRASRNQISKQVWRLLRLQKKSCNKTVLEEYISKYAVSQMTASQKTKETVRQMSIRIHQSKTG